MNFCSTSTHSISGIHASYLILTLVSWPLHMGYLKPTFVRALVHNLNKTTRTTHLYVHMLLGFNSLSWNHKASHFPKHNSPTRSSSWTQASRFNAQSFMDSSLLKKFLSIFVFIFIKISFFDFQWFLHLFYIL